MNDLISPKYQMQLVNSVEQTIWEEFKSYKLVRLYINKWYQNNYEPNGFNHFEENFTIFEKQNKEIDLTSTLHSMKPMDLLRIAIDLGVDTPDFIPSIPTFKNILKSEYKTAYDTFTKAYKQIESDPSLAVGLANSALESIIKEILKDERINHKISGGETLYKLTSIILKEFNLTNDEHPKEIKTIGSSLLAINQSVEKLRSEKTNFHGKTDGDYLITDAIYTHFIVNTVTTVGLFLNSYYQTKFPKINLKNDDISKSVEEEYDDLPF
ncbi:abortive infection Abi-like protein [Flavobacterium endophyticum]|uniref:Abortive infection Abi-like protein n=1 Tax=Flavobacterium endophyticum TaxID=1540163 RepID=A0A495M6W9_9FLAO|nr:abortive infection family protein [Flavobacterium endophyticum]RKS21774.1 abortive infection Abi-like protein [Flavobacterium endophyticum]